MSTQQSDSRSSEERVDAFRESPTSINPRLLQLDATGDIASNFSLSTYAPLSSVDLLPVEEPQTGLPIQPGEQEEDPVLPPTSVLDPTIQHDWVLFPEQNGQMFAGLF